MSKSKFYKFVNISLVALIISFAYYLIFLYYNLYLPPPYYFDINDTFMDHFNTYFYIFSNDKYTDWASIYPNVSFFILNFFFSDENCLLLSSDAFELRECASPKTLITLISIYLIFVLLFTRFAILNSPKKIIKPSLYIKYFIIFLLSPTFLAAFERGNIIFIALIFFLFYFSINSNFIKSFLIALIINIKVYLITMLLPYFVQNRLVLIFFTITLIYLLNLISLSFIYDFNTALIFDNIFKFNESEFSLFSTVYQNISIITLIGLVTGEILILKIMFFIFFLLHFLLIYNKFNSSEILLYILTFSAILFPNVGFYFLIFILICLFACLRKNEFLFYYIVLLLFPFDLLTYQTGSVYSLYSWIGNINIDVPQKIGFGDIMRPISLMLLFFHLSFYKLYSIDHNKVLNYEK